VRFWSRKPLIPLQEGPKNMRQTPPLYHGASQPILWHRGSLKDDSIALKEYICDVQHVPWGDRVLVYSHLVRSF
jgi:hypothetical protein